MEENIAAEFYETYKDCKNPGVELTKFYGKLFSINPEFKKLVPMITMLIRLYGRKTTFFAVTDLYFVNNLKHENIFPLIRFLCKKRFEKDSEQFVDDTMSKTFKEYEVLLRKTGKQKLDIKDPFDD